MQSLHGGERVQSAARLGVDVSRLLDASASLAPFTLRLSWRILHRGVRDYPDRGHVLLKQQLAALHGLGSSFVLPGNGAAELFTWAARDAASLGSSASLSPCFADYSRALGCWDAQLIPVPMRLDRIACFPQPYPLEAGCRLSLRALDLQSP